MGDLANLIPIHRIVEYLTCERRAFIGIEEQYSIPKSAVERAEIILQRRFHLNTKVKLNPVDPIQQPCLFTWDYNGSLCLVVLDEDPFFKGEENLQRLVLQYALHQLGLDDGCWIQLQDKKMFSDVRNPDLVAALNDTIQQIQDLRNVITPPPILDDTSSCKACPMVEACNPFARVNSAPMRTLLPAKDTRLPLIVHLERGKLRKSKGEIVVENKDGNNVQTARFQDISGILLFGKATVTTPLLHECAARNIPVHYHEIDGWYKGSYTPIGGHNIMARIRQYQAAMDLDTCLEIVRGIVTTKILNQRTFLLRNGVEIPEHVKRDLMLLRRKTNHAKSIASIRGFEGQAAKLYFQNFHRMLKTDIPFKFEHRNRRPPKDPVNALLSFGYACLYREMTLAIQQVGLDPWMGFLHVPGSGRAALALDMMEDFRAILVDGVILRMLNVDNVIDQNDFVYNGNSVTLGPKAKSQFLRLFHNRLNKEIKHPLLEVRLSYRRILHAQAQLLIQALGEVDVLYPGFIAR